MPLCLACVPFLRVKFINISPSVGGKGLVDIQPHWVSALAWPEEGPATAWSGESPELLLVGRMDGSLGLIEVVDVSTMHRRELEHCYRKDGETFTSQESRPVDKRVLVEY